MTGRDRLVRRFAGYAIGFFAAVVLWLLLGATSAHAEDGARPGGHAGRGTIAQLTDDVARPLLSETVGATSGTTSTVHAVVAEVPLVTLERAVDPALDTVDRTTDAVADVADTALRAAEPASHAEPSTAHAAPDAAASSASRGRPNAHAAPGAHGTSTQRTARSATLSHMPARPMAVGAIGDVIHRAARTPQVSRVVASPLASPAAPRPEPTSPADEVVGASAGIGGAPGLLPSRVSDDSLPAASVPTPSSVGASSADGPLPDCTPD